MYVIRRAASGKYGTSGTHYDETGADNLQEAHAWASRRAAQTAATVRNKRWISRNTPRNAHPSLAPSHPDPWLVVEVHLVLGAEPDLNSTVQLLHGDDEDDGELQFKFQPDATTD